MHDRICPAGRALDLRHVASDLHRCAPEAAVAPEDHTAAFVAAQDGVGTRPGSHPAPRLGVFLPPVYGRDGLASVPQGLHKQPIRLILSDNTFSGHSYAEPSRFERVAGGIGIVFLVLVPLLVLSHGWPLTLLWGWS